MFSGLEKGFIENEWVKRKSSVSSDPKKTRFLRFMRQESQVTEPCNIIWTSINFGATLELLS